MADDLPWADSELRNREQALLEAKTALERADADSRRQGLTSDMRAAVAQRLAEAQLEFDRRAAAYKSGYELHPQTRLADIYRGAQNVAVKEPTTLEWLARNPSILTAVPKSRAERDMDAKADYILRRIHGESTKADSGPFAWGNYPFPPQVGDYEAEAVRGLGLPGTDLRGNKAAADAWTSPYKYRPFFQSEDREWLPWFNKNTGEYPLMADAATLAGGVAGSYAMPSWPLFAGAARWKDNFIHAGDRAARGDIGGAAKSAAYAIPGLVSPAFHFGAPGSETDWRPAAGAGAARSIDGAELLASLATRGIMPRAGRAGARAMSPASGSVDNIRVFRDELNDLYRRASLVAHPDVGGSVQMQKAVNRAYEAGDRAFLEGVLRRSP